MYLEKHSPTEFIVKGKLQRHYGGEWESVVYNTYSSVRRAREELRRVAAVVASEHNVPLSHVEYA